MATDDDGSDDPFLRARHEIVLQHFFLHDTLHYPSLRRASSAAAKVCSALSCKRVLAMGILGSSIVGFPALLHSDDFALWGAVVLL